MDIMKPTQLGEISLLLTIVGVAVSIFGLGIGALSVSQPVTQSSNAQVGYFPYESTLELRDEGGSVIAWKNGMTWSTQINGSTTNGNIVNPGKTLAQLSWLGPAPESMRNSPASVTVQVNDYELISSFCEDRAGNTCKDVSSSLSSKRMSNIRIVEGAKITYGWFVRPVSRRQDPTPIVTSRPTSAPTVRPSPQPTSRSTPAPTRIPTLQCSRKCIFSEATTTHTRCYEGACPSNRPECGGDTPQERINNGNQGCKYAEVVCGGPIIEVSCTTGQRISSTTPIPTRTPQPPTITLAPPVTAVPTQRPAPTSHPNPGPQEKVKVLLIINDFVLQRKSGKDLSELYNFHFLDLAKEARDSISQSSPVYDYEFSKTIYNTELPRVFGRVRLDYQEEVVVNCIENIPSKRRGDDFPGSCQDLKDLGFDYDAFEKKHNICEMVNKDEIDEVWQVIIPGYRIGENDMLGPRPYPFGGTGNAAILSRCKKNIPMLNIDVTRDVGNAIHSYHHRIESVVSDAYGWTNSPWADYVNASGKPSTQSPIYGCGGTHYPPNGDTDYDYSNTTDQLTSCDTYKSYPEYLQLEGVVPGRGRLVNCLEWNCTQQGFIEWNMRKMPANSGRDSLGKLNNWWKYAVDLTIAERDRKQGALFSDVNGDNVVNALDLSSLYVDFGKDVNDSTVSNVYHDVNNDNFVNTLDLHESLEHYGETFEYQPQLQGVHETYWE